MSFTHTHKFPLNATPAAVFSALTQPEELKRWFAEHAEVEPKVGGAYRFWGKSTLGQPAERDAVQRITAFELDKTLGFTWPVHGIDSEVTLGVASGEKGTELRVTHRVDGDLAMPRSRELIEDHWHLAAANLIAHLAGNAPTLPDYADPNPEVRITIGIDAPPEHVFRALLEPERLARWIGANSAIVEPRAGGRYVLGWKYKVDGRDVDGGPTRVIEIVPNEKLVLDWADWRGDASVVGQTIAFTLTPDGSGGTSLTFVHAGFGRTTDMGDYANGWAGFLEMLKAEAEGREIPAA